MMNFQTWLQDRLLKEIKKVSSNRPPPGFGEIKKVSSNIPYGFGGRVPNQSVPTGPLGPSKSRGDSDEDIAADKISRAWLKQKTGKA